MTNQEIEVLIDGLLTPVDKAEWEANPEAVTEAVRSARAEQRLPEDAEEALDYDTLVGDDTLVEDDS